LLPLTVCAGSANQVVTFEAANVLSVASAFPSLRLDSTSFPISASVGSICTSVPLVNPDRSVNTLDSCFGNFSVAVNATQLAAAGLVTLVPPTTYSLCNVTSAVEVLPSTRIDSASIPNLDSIDVFGMLLGNTTASFTAVFNDTATELSILNVTELSPFDGTAVRLSVNASEFRPNTTCVITANAPESPCEPGTFALDIV
jgi:hypothetical protein